MSVRGSFTARTFAKYAKDNQLDIVTDTNPDATNGATNQEITLAAEKELVKPVFKRYIILFLFCLNAGNKAFQWIQISALTTKATIMYNTDNSAINVTSFLFMLAFVVLSWPACHIIERFGMRKAVVTASFGTATGAIIKCFSCHEHGIWLLILAQCTVSLSEQLIFSMPSRMISVWFPDHEVSSAMAFSVFGQQCGVALGFVVPQLFLDGTETQAEIAKGFYHLFLFTAGVSVTAFVLCFFLFDEEPEFAPGLARLRQRQIERANASLPGESLMTQLGKLFRQIGSTLKNRHLVFLALSYGMNVGVTYVISTLLNQMLQLVWPDDDMIVGNTGFFMIVTGAIGLPMWGRVMDTWHSYKLINVMLTIIPIGCLMFFTYAVDYAKSVLWLYVSAAILGFFHTGFVVTGLELAVELTYPNPELVTSSIMNVMPNIFGTFFILLGSYIVDNYGPLATNVFYLVCMALALVFLLLSRGELNRQKAVAAEKQKELTSA